jgi:indolepyruvate ferredoxin oxidoreductase
MEKAFSWLARLRRLRGTPFDPFGYHPERKAERALIAQYEADIGALLDGLDAARLPRAIALARLPEDIRGFGHVKAWSMKKAAEKRAALLAPAKPGHQGGAQVA